MIVYEIAIFTGIVTAVVGISSLKTWVVKLSHYIYYVSLIWEELESQFKTIKTQSWVRLWRCMTTVSLGLVQNKINSRMFSSSCISHYVWPVAPFSERLLFNQLTFQLTLQDCNMSLKNQLKKNWNTLLLYINMCPCKEIPWSGYAKANNWPTCGAMIFVLFIFFFCRKHANTLEEH